MKKLLALLLAMAMAFSLVACGNKTGGSGDNTDPDQIADDPTSADGTYEIAMITDVGALKDKSFNEGTWNGVKLYAANNNKTYKYYQPPNGANATDDDRYSAYVAAIDNGAKVIVAPGFLQESAMRRAAVEHPEVNFIFIDGYSLTERADQNDPGEVLTNVAGIMFQEEQCGYLAGYAVVKEGFTKLGFSGGGGGTNPACCRYGYGYVQGANAAAAELGVNVEMRYSWEYGSSYSPSPELQSMMQGWYNGGTEVVFACGGGMFNSVANAASSNDGYVVGVDVDQSSQSDTVITSAMKGLADATQWACTKAFDGSWSEIGNSAVSLGAKDNATGLPTATWSMKNYKVADYEKQFKDVVDGKLVIDADFNNLNQAWSNLTLNII